jgi:hypothetical protein
MGGTQYNTSDETMEVSTPAYDNVWAIWQLCKHLGYTPSNGRIWIGQEAGVA